LLLLRAQPVLQVAPLLLLAVLLLSTVLTPHACHLESLAVHLLQEATQQAAQHRCLLC
jgi:hypothetical protein